jgi:acetoin utilization deacetylase AcuC-like enzyme
MTPLQVVLNEAHTGYAPETELGGGVPVPAFDSVSRIERILSVMREQGGWEIRRAREHGRDPILRVHSAELVGFLERAWALLGPHRPAGSGQVVADTFLHEKLRAGIGPPTGAADNRGALGLFCFDTYGSVGPATFEAALGSVDAALTAVDLVVGGEPLAIALTRPPGHHVTREIFGGGCYLNNAGIAAQALRDAGYEKVAVIDIDFHHGNGTQSLFYDREDVLYASVHGSPDRHYPYHVGWPEERGTGAGEEATLNVTLPDAPDGSTYRACLARVLEKAAAFSPSALVVSLGVDTLRGDPSGDGRLSLSDLSDVGADVGALGLPSVLLLEGGYELTNLGQAFTRCVQGIAGGGRR